MLNVINEYNKKEKITDFNNRKKNRTKYSHTELKYVLKNDFDDFIFCISTLKTV